jgi:hypothetical protein
MYRGNRGHRGHSGGRGGWSDPRHKCAWCTPGSDAAEAKEVRRWCTVFRTLKAATASISYLEPELKEPEVLGFAGAGVLPMRRCVDGDVELLFAREYREPSDDNVGGDKLDFLGGKRNARIAIALDVAVDKLDQETARCLSRGAIARMRAKRGCPIVVWSPGSKFALYQHEFTCTDDKDVDIRCAGVRGAKRLEWVSRAQLRNDVFVRLELHSFAATTLREIDDAGVLDALERVFDAGTAAAIASNVPIVPTVLEPSRFDVVAALREAALAARPGTSVLPIAPCWADFMRALGVLHKTDIRKLQLRFHPDRLMRELGREPSLKEIALGNKAMTFLNALFEKPPNELCVLNEAKMLKAEIAAAERVLAAAAAHEAAVPPSSGGSGGAEDLAELLSSLRM